MTAQQERVARRKANAELYTLGLTYHESIPLVWLDRVLVTAGFNQTEEAIYCGRDGHSLEQVGEWSWLSLSWHKMESGRYEIVAYLS
jgi:hypothetical protein